MSLTGCVECWPVLCKCCYQPKGSMCMACKKRDEDCSALPFHTMPRLEGDADTQIIVRCTKFERKT